MFGELKTKYRLTFVLVLIIQGSFLCAQPDCFVSGNESYKKENYPEAIAFWEKCLADGHVSAHLHYNLGNAYLQQEAYSRAILHYEKAKGMDDVEGLNANLRLARMQLDDEVPVFSDFFLIKGYKALMTIVHPNVWVATSIVILMCLLWLLFGFWAQERYSLSGISIVGVIALCSVVMAFQTTSYQQGLQYGIVMVKADLFSGSDDRSEKIRGVGAGNKVRLLDSLGTWIKIELPAKERGWMLIEQVARL